MKFIQKRKRGTPSQYFKSCPTCDNKIFFCDKYRLNDSVKNNKECGSCAKTGNKNPFYGKIYTKEERRINGIKVKNSPKYKKWIQSGETSRRSREMVLRRIMEIGIPIGVNKNGCKFFKELNNKLKWNGIYFDNSPTKMEHKVLGYLLDYYEPTLNIIVEWDEERHYKSSVQREKDIIRQKNLINHLNCQFYRIREKTKEISKIDNLKTNYIKKIKEVLNETKI